MMKKELIETSKFLSLILRHKPQVVGLELGDGGWVDVDTLLAACRKRGKNITRELLDEVVRDNDKQRFAFNDDRTRIRASQGHSLHVDLDLKPSVPPERLYHGTVDRFLPDIKREGLLKMQRHHVHLSSDEATASKVGQRRGRPVVLTILAKEMWEAGHRFYISDNGVWLTEHVPPEYLRTPL